jgi:peptidoglycan/xylan/chitin deacetylase (PgdA/CDA1 family)
MGIPLRCDRLATLYLVHPLTRVLRNDLGKKVPILMYHDVSDVPDHASHPYFQTNTDPATFRMQMEWLSENGYRVISLAKIEEELARPAGENGKSCVITFDDGFRNFRKTAFPVLNRFGFTATVFLATGYIGRRFKEKECLDWGEVLELQAEGIEFGSHTVSHPTLHGMTSESIRIELMDSKTAIEDATGKPVQRFSYPYAFPQEDRGFVDHLGRALRKCGYSSGVTTRIGRAAPGDDPMFLRRIPVNMHDDEPLFRAKLEGGYDWLRSPQYAFRFLKRGIPGA